MGAGVSVMGRAYPLGGCSILIVEDEPLIALELHDVLHRAGGSILAATNVKDALVLITYADISAAVLDISLATSDCSALCIALARRSIPFIFYTGCAVDDVLPAWSRVPIILKPATGANIVDAVAGLMHVGWSGGTA